MNVIGGAILPLSSMPEIVQTVGKILPTSHSVAVLRSIAVKGLGPESWLPELLYLLLFGTAVLVLAIVTFRFAKAD
jgi:ABC-2 type transport system permease protein